MNAELTRALGRHDVLAPAFGAMIGWGWVVLSGEMIARAGTVGSALAFVVGAAMGILMAPHRGDITRRKLARRAGETRDQVVDKVEDLMVHRSDEDADDAEQEANS